MNIQFNDKKLVKSTTLFHLYPYILTQKVL